MSQALYRRYRPETFAEVIGQEHVTGPLQQALRNNRVHHAYLLSGPRGCGKTTSARILARCLNCEQGPTPEPCGRCRSCQDLARTGPGSLDVLEIDAASHGGVDDARELRERAHFAPAASRFKIYIIDEAHMVSSAGFNALLKVVEEPPEHVKFVFATTEPDKVIGTIRSRTHHYPFRLVPPGQLQDYLARLCVEEGVPVEKTVLPLVVRAGRGSVRDSLSVLDELIGGADTSGVTYALATALLGYTDASLLDDTIDAFAAGDGAAVFAVIDRVIEAGLDPRRFADDLLERLRDLIILDAVPDAGPRLLGDVPGDQLERMRSQAGRFGSAELSRAADLVNAGLIEMRGATAPRLQLELICARVLLPAAAGDERSVAARLDRLERRVSLGGMPAPASGSSGEGPSRPAVPPAPRLEDAAPRRGLVAPPSLAAPAAPEEQAEDRAAEETAAERAVAERSQAARPEVARTAASPRPLEQDAPAAAVPAAGLDLLAVRRMWPDVLDAVKGMRRYTWTLLSHNAQVSALDGRRLVLGMQSAGARDRILAGGNDEIVRQALIDVLGVDWKVEAIVDSGAALGGGPRAAARASADAETGEAIDVRRPAPAAVPAQAPSRAASPDDEPSPDDPDLHETGLTHLELLQRNLGARVIEEYETG